MGETSFAIIQKSWDSIFNAEGQGDYAAAKIEGNIRMGKYTHYKEVQPVSFKVNDGMFVFSVSGNMTVPAEKIEKENFYGRCSETSEAWVSYFNKPMVFDGDSLIVEIAGVDLACGNELFAVGDLKVKFANAKAQEYWKTKLEGYQKYKREQLVEFRKAEQEHRSDIRDKSGMFKDPRDGQMYRTIKVEGREWFAHMVEERKHQHDSSKEKKNW